MCVSPCLFLSHFFLKLKVNCAHVNLRLGVELFWMISPLVLTRGGGGGGGVRCTACRAQCVPSF